MRGLGVLYDEGIEPGIAGDRVPAGAAALGLLELGRKGMGGEGDGRDGKGGRGLRRCHS